MIKGAWRFLNTEAGLHHVIHFLLAWLIMDLTDGKWVIVFVLCGALELRDWHIKRETSYYKMADHIDDIFSWMLGAIVYHIYSVSPYLWWLREILQNLPV